MYQPNNNINSKEEIQVKEEFAVQVNDCNKPIELAKPKLERQIAFNIKDLQATKLWSDIVFNTDIDNSKLWTDIVFNTNKNSDFDTESDDDDDEEWDFIDLLNRILCNCKLINKLITCKKVRPI
jgi:hypothetical protein